MFTVLPLLLVLSAPGWIGGYKTKGGVRAAGGRWCRPVSCRGEARTPGLVSRSPPVSLIATRHTELDVMVLDEADGPGPSLPGHIPSGSLVKPVTPPALSLSNWTPRSAGSSWGSTTTASNGLR